MTRRTPRPSAVPARLVRQSSRVHVPAVQRSAATASAGRPLPLGVAVAMLVALFAAPAAAVQITLDYRFDSAGFFAANPAAQAALQAAADLFAVRLTDSLDAIAPDASNTWSMRFYRPDTDALGNWVTNPTVAANTLWVFVGARDLPAGVLGETSSGGYTADGYDPWFNTLDTRGEINAVGPGATDFGPWGGAIAFDLDADGNGWHFDHTAPVTAGASDFYSVAVHELAHILGVGIAESWDRLVEAGVFVGVESVATYGAPVPLDPPYHWHWADNVQSTVNGHYQEAALTPYLTLGTRRHMTDLEWAALADIGWVVTPQAIAGDLNGDRLVNTEDINPFVLALTSAAGFAAAYPGVDRLAAGDINHDGNVDTEDINPFVQLLVGGGGWAVAIPEPATLAFLLAAPFIARRRKTGSFARWGDPHGPPRRTPPAIAP